MFTIVLATPQFALPMLPLMWVYLRSMQFYRPVARELKRLEPLARSPVYSEQQAAATGVALIRKLGLGHVMAARALHAIDGNTAVVFAARAVDRWFSLRMELLGNLIVLASALVCLAATGTGAWSEARSAIAVTQALSVCGLLNWTVRTIARLGCRLGADESESRACEADGDELHLVAARGGLLGQHRLGSSEGATRRCAPAGSVARERQHLLQGRHGTWPGVWVREWHRMAFFDPSEASDLAQDVSFRYREKLPLVLQKLNLQLTPGQRVGVVGRTGSGKSTLLRRGARGFLALGVLQDPLAHGGSQRGHRDDRRGGHPRGGAGQAAVLGDGHPSGQLPGEWIDPRERGPTEGLRR